MEEVDRMLKTGNAHNTSYHWHNIVNAMNRNIPVDLIETDSASWCEMDTIDEFRGV